MNTTKTGNRHYDIVSGPNKDMLFDVCKYAYNESARLSVDFTVAIGTTMPKGDPGCAYITMAITDVKITGIEHEDGSGEKFNLHGYCKANPNSIGTVNIIYAPYRFNAYYNSKTRKGWITFIEQ